MKKYICKTLLVSVIAGCMLSCDDFLDREPIAQIAPEQYFKDATQLKAYCDNLYASILPSHTKNTDYGIFKNDAGTDNQVTTAAEQRYMPDLWKVVNAESGDWQFERIYRLNYFFSCVLPKFGTDLDGSDLSGAQNTISGDLTDIRHHIGEAYVLRALEYFNRYQKFGDFPIITEPLPDDSGILTEASKRMPRNEVARFILSDLDKAVELLSAKTMNTTRINKDVALLLKSRVSLYEGTWLKYFKGTAFVPQGEGWPGKAKDYNAGYEYPSGSIDNEINYFLEAAMAASKEVAEAYKEKLTKNTGFLQQSTEDEANPYYNMFAQEDLSAVPEVLLWRQYSRDLVTHNVNVAANQGNMGVGVTRAYVNSFLMEDGTPVYKHGDNAGGDGYYLGDKTIHDVRQNRDSRLQLFLKEPGQINILYENIVGNTAWMTEPYPNITFDSGKDGYATGYALRKGGSFDQKFYENGKGYTAAICYRAVEALLNYMEASYERTGNLDGSAREYWQLIRQRAHVSTDIDATIAATNMNEDAKNDWGAYSAGQIVSDKTLYNIRRERRCEMLAEGLRYMDLCRWRAMDQMITTPYFVEGIHLWNTPMENWYKNLVADGTDKSNVSPESVSEYLRPHQKNSKQNGYNGYTWKMAHYLTPLMVKQFLLTASDGATISTSPLYQNPYWPIIADQPAER